MKYTIIDQSINKGYLLWKTNQLSNNRLNNYQNNSQINTKMEISCMNCKLPYGTNYLKCLVCAKKGSKRNINRYDYRNSGQCVKYNTPVQIVPIINQPKVISYNELSLDDAYEIYTSDIDYSPIFIKFMLYQMGFCEDLVVFIMSKYLKSSESHIDLMRYDFDVNFRSNHRCGFLTLFDDREHIHLFKQINELDQPHGIKYENFRWCFFTIYETDFMSKVHDLW